MTVKLVHQEIPHTIQIPKHTDSRMNKLKTMQFKHVQIKALSLVSNKAYSAISDKPQLNFKGSHCKFL